MQCKRDVTCVTLQSLSLETTLYGAVPMLEDFGGAFSRTTTLPFDRGVISVTNGTCLNQAYLKRLDQRSMWCGQLEFGPCGERGIGDYSQTRGSRGIL